MGGVSLSAKLVIAAIALEALAILNIAYWHIPNLHILLGFAAGGSAMCAYFARGL